LSAIVRNNSNYSLIWDYILVFLLVATSGIVFFYSNEEYIAIGLIISLAIFFKRGMLGKIDLKFILILSIFILGEVIQSFYFQSFSLKSVIGTFGRFAFAYVVIKSVGERFIDKYINLIYFLSIISLVFYILFFFPSITNKLVSIAIKDSLFPSKNQFYQMSPNFILITFNGYQQLRNSGPFWEPGAFSVFLNIALLLNILVKNKIADKKNIVFIITVITTLSTAGFLTLFFIISAVYFFLRPSLKKVFVLAPMIILFTVLIINIPFLLPKIKDNVIIAENDNSSRFGSALSDYELIYENPILGYGRDIGNMYNTSNWNIKKMHRNNGITNFVTQWGIIIFVIYFYNYKKSADSICIYYKSNKSLSFIFLISMILLGFSQGLFQYPFFHALIFLQFSYSLIETVSLVKESQDVRPIREITN